MQHKNERARIAIVSYEHGEKFRTGNTWTAICALASANDRIWPESAGMAIWG